VSRAGRFERPLIKGPAENPSVLTPMPVTHVQGLSQDDPRYDAFIAQWSGRIAQFQQAMRQQHALGVVEYTKVFRDYPEMRLGYANLQGQETILIEPRLAPIQVSVSEPYVDKLLIELVTNGYGGTYTPYAQPYTTSVTPSRFVMGSYTTYPYWTIFGPDYTRPVEVPTVLEIYWEPRYQNGQCIGYISAGSSHVEPPVMRLPTGLRDPRDVGTLERYSEEYASQCFELGVANADYGGGLALNGAIAATSFGCTGSPLQRSISGASSTVTLPRMTYVRPAVFDTQEEEMTPANLVLDHLTDVRMLVLDLKKLREVYQRQAITIPIAAGLSPRMHFWPTRMGVLGGERRADAIAHPLGTTPMPECGTDTSGMPLDPGQPLRSVAFTMPDPDVAEVIPANPLTTNAQGWEFGGFLSSVDYPYYMLGTYEPLLAYPTDYGVGSMKIVTTTKTGGGSLEEWMRTLDDRTFEAVRSNAQSSQVVADVAMRQPHGTYEGPLTDPPVAVELHIDCLYGTVRVVEV
jgi:hypothetical protein